MGASELREIFLKTSNDINGDYFAELIQVSVREYNPYKPASTIKNEKIGEIKFYWTNDFGDK